MAVVADDVLCRCHYDGNHTWDTTGVLLAHNDGAKEKEALDWLRAQIKPGHTLNQVAALCLVVWQTLADNKPFAELKTPENPPLSIPGKKLEAALLDRKISGAVHSRELELK